MTHGSQRPTLKEQSPQMGKLRSVGLWAGPHQQPHILPPIPQEPVTGALEQDRPPQRTGHTSHQCVISPLVIHFFEPNCPCLRPTVSGRTTHNGHWWFGLSSIHPASVELGGTDPRTPPHSSPIILSLWLPGLLQGQAGDLNRKKRLSAEMLLEDK